jgi:hypothetical protein
MSSISSSVQLKVPFNQGEAYDRIRPSSNDEVELFSLVIWPTRMVKQVCFQVQLNMPPIEKPMWWIER